MKRQTKLKVLVFFIFVVTSCLVGPLVMGDPFTYKTVLDGAFIGLIFALLVRFPEKKKETPVENHLP